MANYSGVILAGSPTLVKPSAEVLRQATGLGRYAGAYIRVGPDAPRVLRPMATVMGEIQATSGMSKKMRGLAHSLDLVAVGKAGETTGER